ncbi:hypothetical protein PT974_02759 [Cladobotryum mycophilum]|uniref:Proteophosphoglycan 5 n=1 Tax=Cladobotryum mycophilum TaxID=491253 RepID=A0ABR0SZ14_9HYPO
MDNTSPPKATPARRKNGRYNGRAAGQKAYASENDVPVYSISRQHKTPQTPDKAGFASPAPANGNVSQTSSKQRNKTTKPKPKNLPTSPENDDSSPPHRSPLAKARASTAFAGATFHASPAPSALPIPSFLSKSSSESPLPRKEIIQEPSPPATDTEVPTPYRPSSVSRNHESPLDFMFRAHREEKLRETASVKKPFNQAGPISPPSNFDLSNFPSTVPQARRSHVRQSFHGIDSFELDGSPGQPMGPAFSTPYQDRIKAARGPRPSPSQDPSRPSPQPVTEDPTEALKRFLFGGASPSNTGPSTHTVAPAPFSGSINAVPLPNTQVNAPAFGRTNNLQAMENDLRRILKLDLASDAPPTERRLFTR